MTRKLYSIDANVIYESDKATDIELVEEAVKKNISLYMASLRWDNLRNANLKGAYLRGADFYGAYLRGADFCGAYLRNANLRAADLHYANLHYANLRNADLGYADLRGAKLYGADLHGSRLYGADLCGIKGYYNHHDIFFELIRRIPPKDITNVEWQIIGELTIHRHCWNWIIKKPKKTFLRMLKRLADEGFDEYLIEYNRRLK